SVLFVSMQLTGRFVPATFSGRRWLWFGEITEPWHRLVVAFIYQWIDRIEAYELFIALSRASHILVFVLSFVGLVRLLLGKSWTLLFMISIVGVDLVAYLVMLPTPGHGGRYQAILMPLALPLLALGLIAIVRSATAFALPARPVFGAAAATMCLAV